MKASACLPLLLVLPASLLGQQADSSQRLPDIAVSVTRTPTRLSQLGAAVTVLDSAALHRNRLAPTLDDVLGFVPGIVVANRWNFSLDQRLSIRGFGARANFGWRGVKVLIDGVPQTLPDGQSQLNHLDLAEINRVEVLRGAASAEYGNASGGVIAFTTNTGSQRPALVVGAEQATFGTTRMQLFGSGRAGGLGGTLSLSQFRSDGFRQHSTAAQKRLNAGLSYILNPSSTLSLRLSVADDPRADNPGALTTAEVAARLDSAAASNIRRNAGKAVTQSQIAASYLRESNHLRAEVTAWRLVRNLDNPLAAPPPPPITPTDGTWVGIDRLAGGARSTLSYQFSRATTTIGIDYQRMRDDRINQRSAAGVPTGSILLNQEERVTEVGPFIHTEWRVSPSLTMGLGTRWDQVNFAVDDHLQSQGDAGGKRSMHAASGSMRLAWNAKSGATAWVSLATSFETPTTTELANQPSGETGLNRELDPQRSLTSEAGFRTSSSHISWEAAAWLTSTRRALVPAQDVGGRTYYQNAGRTRTTGIEGTLQWALIERVKLLGTATITDAVFKEYFSALDNVALDGNLLAGLPKAVGRVGVRANLGRGFLLDLDQTLRGKMFADDRNQLAVEGLGAGVTGARVSWTGHVLGWEMTTFGTLLNAFDRRYIGSVTINGSAGRSLEPAAGRTMSIGLQVGTR